MGWNFHLSFAHTAFKIQNRQIQNINISRHFTTITIYLYSWMIYCINGMHLHKCNPTTHHYLSLYIHMYVSCILRTEKCHQQQQQVDSCSSSFSSGYTKKLVAYQKHTLLTTINYTTTFCPHTWVHSVRKKVGGKIQARICLIKLKKIHLSICLCIYIKLHSILSTYCSY